MEASKLHITCPLLITGGFPYKGLVMQKTFPYHDVIIMSKYLLLNNWKYIGLWVVSRSVPLISYMIIK